MKFLGIIFLTTISMTAAFAQVPANLVGSWFEGSSSILQERNTITGAIASRYGSSIGYVLEANGKYRYAGLMKSTMYGCTTTLWNDNRGSFKVAGDVITFVPVKDYWLNTNSCASSSNKETNKPVVTKSYNYEIAEKDGRSFLCMREVGKTADKDVLCYPRSRD